MQDRCTRRTESVNLVRKRKAKEKTEKNRMEKKKEKESIKEIVRRRREEKEKWNGMLECYPARSCPGPPLVHHRVCVVVVVVLVVVVDLGSVCWQHPDSGCCFRRPWCSIPSAVDGSVIVTKRPTTLLQYSTGISTNMDPHCCLFLRSLVLDYIDVSISSCPLD